MKRSPLFLLSNLLLDLSLWRVAPYPYPLPTQTETDKVEATVEVCPTVQKTLTNLSEANKTIDYWTEVEATSELNIVELDHQTIATTTELTVSLLPCPITIPRQIPAPISFPVEVPAPMAPISFQDARCFADTTGVVPFKRSLNWLTIRQLQKRAREAQIPKYSRMPKLKMIAALQAV